MPDQPQESRGPSPSLLAERIERLSNDVASMRREVREDLIGLEARIESRLDSRDLASVHQSIAAVRVELAIERRRIDATEERNRFYLRALIGAILAVVVPAVASALFIAISVGGK